MDSLAMLAHFTNTVENRSPSHLANLFCSHHTMPARRRLHGRDLKELIEEEKICFKGAVSSREWPPGLRHHFEVLNQISFLRYDEYMSDKPNNNEMRERIMDLRREVRRLRANFGTSELTYRTALEGKILRRFDEEVKW